MPDDVTNSQAVQTHLQISQSVIQRMASNSAACKAWCISLVSAIVVIVATTEKGQYTLIIIIPTVLFLILDTYYLTLEKMFRQSYNSFIEKLHTGEVTTSDFYIVSPSGSMVRGFSASFISFSIWPFYLTLLVMTFVIKSIVF